MMDPNGCTCNETRAYAAKRSSKMPFDWKCIACTAREKEAKSGHTCRGCGIGVYDYEHERGKCTACYWG